MSKALDARFSSLDVTQTTRAELHATGGIPRGGAETGAAADEERKTSNQSGFDMSDQEEEKKV